MALRDSFATQVSWIPSGSDWLRLPPLGAAERQALLVELLPAPEAADARARLAQIPSAGNPLYLEHAAALLRATGYGNPPAASLHAAVLARLELVLDEMARRPVRQLGPSDIAAVEQTVGEWLDRLETGDYDDRAALGTYLGLLEQIDAALVIAAATAWLPLVRNRRLAEAIERFYSASFPERLQAIEQLATHDRINAAHAAARGARAMASLRLDDAIGYLDLAARLTSGRQQAQHLLALGGLWLARDRPRAAWHRYAAAMRIQLDLAAGPADQARCWRRLGRAALRAGRPATAARLLQRAVSALDAAERLLGEADLAEAYVALSRPAAAERVVRRWDREDPRSDRARILALARLRLAWLAGSGDLTRLSRDAASALVFGDDRVADLTDFVETVRLLVAATPAHVDPNLRRIAALAARRLTGQSMGPRPDAVDADVR